MRIQSVYVDSVFVTPGMRMDLTFSGLGVDKLYLTSAFADYQFALTTATTVTITRGACATLESVMVGFVDRGRNIVIGDWRDESVTLAALQLSAAKWGSFQVTGNDEYKALCVKLAAQHGFRIDNPEPQKGI